MKLYNRFKKNIKYFSLVLGVSLVSCSDDYLDVGAYGTPVLSNFYQTETDAEQGLIAAYSPLREMYGTENFLASTSNDLLFGDIGTDDILKGGARSNDGPQLFDKEIFNMTTSNTAIEAVWKVCYKGILYANLVLDKVPDIEFTDADYQKQILAEARFLRAYYYFDLVNSFGGVPLVDKPLETGEYVVPRSTQEEIYTFIEDDLKVAIEDLPSRFDQGTAYLGHADKGAALGMMMRVSLYQNKMGQVKTYGDQLLAMPYVLQDYSTLFNNVGEWNSGSVFEINFSSNANKLGTLMPRMMTPRSIGGIGFGQIKQELIDAYEPNDPRLEASFYQLADGGYGTTWYNRKYAWAPYSDYEIPTTGGFGNSANNVRVLRLADVYLMYAEAVYSTDPTTAIEYVNKVRKRARESGGSTVGIPADLPTTLTGDDLRDAIYKERRLELAGEGFRYHDLIRTGRAEAVLGSSGFVTNKYEIMPIPLSQVLLSQGVLTQNNY
ncbi:RagB/SusD family nutrient uptake outer membrane protein [Wenyingzhuangia sp. 2_MG-2023]|uniref:RagB/SusD family nutrient uptake outer membrane protein n=1 Tax=Wenyingzhuangia sp. 2_MG-2023 TaxID=3062639 RepID=UPI0026E36CCB|nr:RagB/SusD family nutrient uptake outer membrane protein [Wenyingzhuangia sp. 2_MG-2023]MDO6738632.1 RagB/SusD family nutrient uptake outer membrane protein [Wenyingzhuangia sp. 2_MG-2023]